MTHVPIRIPLEPLVSSNISAGGYDPDKKILAIEFKSGDIFHYAGVELEVATAFYCAESKGTYYGKNIRGKFTGEKMTGPCGACGAVGWIGDRCDECGCDTFQATPYKPKRGNK